MFRQTYVTAIALLGLTGAAAAQSTCPAPAVAATMDLVPIAGSNLMTVPVAINDTPKKFLLDIGTSPDQVSEPTRSELHLAEIDRSTPATSAMTGLNTTFQLTANFVNVKAGGPATDYRARVRASSFAIGGGTVNSVEFVVADDRNMGKSEPYDGLLTANMFAQYDFNLDFGAKKFSFLAATQCGDPNQIAYWPHKVVAVVPMTIRNGKFSVPVTIDGHQINAVIDTGSDHTVMRRDISDLNFGFKADTPAMMPAGDMRDGQDARIYTHTFAQIAFEGVVANNVPVLIETNSMVHKLNRTPVLGSRAQFASDPSDRIPDLALGMDLLRQLHVYIATAQNTIYVTPAQ